MWLLIGSFRLLQDTAWMWGVDRGAVKEGRSESDEGRSRSRSRSRIGMGCGVLREGDRSREHD